MTEQRPLRVVVVGGGLAGMATAVALESAGATVTLLEARRSLGGRAGSYEDPQTGEQLDNCQHVLLGCCTNLLDFYRRIGAIGHRPVPFDQVMDFSIIQKLGQDAKYASQKVEYGTQVAPKELQAVRAEGEEILTNTVVMHFFPNSWDPFKKVTRMTDGKSVEELYDPNVNNVLEEIAQLAGQFGAHAAIDGNAPFRQLGGNHIGGALFLKAELGMRMDVAPDMRELRMEIDYLVHQFHSCLRCCRTMYCSTACVPSLIWIYYA